MFASLNNNKWQILISSSIGILYFNSTKNELYSMFLVLSSAIILRNLKVDNLINKYLEKNKSKKNVENFYAKTKEEKLAFLKTMNKAEQYCKKDKSKLCKSYVTSSKQMKKDLNKILVIANKQK